MRTRRAANTDDIVLMLCVLMVVYVMILLNIHSAKKEVLRELCHADYPRCVVGVDR